MKRSPIIVAVSGFSSNVGKTTLVCELLRKLPGWEAIKLTRGHYRSCGRDPAGCCVSDLLREEPVIRSGREANYQVGKDTGRFWEAGASNVHWVIVKDDQVSQGITEALSRVESAGVIVEGNSFLEYIRSDLVIMCARSEGGKIKPSARRALAKSDFLYLSSRDATPDETRRQFEEFCARITSPLDLGGLPIITHADIRTLLSKIYQPSLVAMRPMVKEKWEEVGKAFPSNLDGLKMSGTHRSLEASIITSGAEHGGTMGGVVFADPREGSKNTKE
jgi:molybdopterin-guanine dinucleotide biosynthesis protein